MTERNGGRRRPLLQRRPSGSLRLHLPIREQLSILVAVTAVSVAGVLSLIFWINNRQLIADVTSDRLSMSVSMKSAQIAQAFAILHHAAYAISTRTNVRNALRRYAKSGNNTLANWERVDEDLQNAASMNDGGFHEIMQIVLFDINLGNGTNERWVENGTYLDGVIVGNSSYNGFLPNGTRINIGAGRQGDLGLFNLTGDNAIGVVLPPTPANGGVSGPMLLPERGHPNSTEFWQEVERNLTEDRPVHDGFPRELYPVTDRGQKLLGDPSTLYSTEYIQDYGGLLLGPMMVNSTLALISLTFPVYDQVFGEQSDLIGFSTIVMNASSLLTILYDNRGMGKTGQTLLVGPGWINGLWNDTRISSNKLSRTLPTNQSNRQNDNITPSELREEVKNYQFVYLFPPKNLPELAGQQRALSSYQAVEDMYVNHITGKNGASDLDAQNSDGRNVGVGYALTSLYNNLGDWGILIEQSKKEAFAPISQLEKLLLATAFGTFAVIMIIVWPIAHWSVRPIARLRAATEKTTRSVNIPDPSRGGTGDASGPVCSAATVSDCDDAEKGRLSFYTMRKKLAAFARRPSGPADDEDNRKREGFRIPAKVRERKHLVYDELTDLTTTFNEMTDELVHQYSTLEDRVIERTKELNEQKEIAEEQRRLAEEQRQIAEKANQAKSLFIANISHELRTPLNAILNMCDVAADQAAAAGIVDVKESMHIAIVAGKSLLHLITDLLTFSKNQVGAIAEKPIEEYLSITDIEQQVGAVFGKLADERGIKLEVERSQEDLGDYVFIADEKRITQCLLNLIGNGLKFTPAGGFVRLESKALRAPNCASCNASTSSSELHKPGPSHTFDAPTTAVSPISDSPPPSPTDTAPTIAESHPSTPFIMPEQCCRLQFRVTDDGPGIPSHLHQKVFEPFVQAEVGLSKRYDGVGLGLSICHQIIDMMHGTIRLESSDDADNHGTTFTVELPVRCNGTRKADEQSGDKEQTLLWGKDHRPSLSGQLPAPALTVLPTPPPSRSLRILVAEDNPTNRKVIVQMLRLQSQTDVTLATDGREALHMIRAAMHSSTPFDVVLMDIQMPHMDGIECTKTVRELGYTAPIVALTAYADDMNEKECLEAGMNYFLVKPINKHHLRQVLKVVTDGTVAVKPLRENGLPSPPTAAGEGEPESKELGSSQSAQEKCL